MSNPRRPRPTLRDVAERAGVSSTTASFVLSGRRDMRISPATEERVLEAARRLGYHRRLAPRTALSSSAPAIGFISDTVATEAFGGEMIRGCIAAAADHGHTMLIAETEGVHSLEESAVQGLLQRGVERFVYAAMATSRFSVPEALRHTRLVMLNGVDRKVAGHAVVPDDHGAGRSAAEALVTAGHTSGIWLVGELRDGLAATERLAGITSGLHAAGLELAGHLSCGWWPEDTRDAVAGLLSAGGDTRPGAVIAMNDRAAMGIYQAATSAGLRIPDDLSVVSFDNSDLARWLSPGLTSVALPYFHLGRRAVELLLSDAPDPRVHTVAMPLHPRGSVAAPRRPSPAPALRRYRSPDEDSARWAGFTPRDGDVVVSSRSKHGTTWVQSICLFLMHGAPELPGPVARLSPWLDWLVEPLDEVLARLQAQPYRRVVKTHTPLDGLPRDPRTTYVVPARHPLDAAVSLWHQSANIDRERPPLPPLREWLVDWVATDADPRAELDSLPGVLHHVRDAWARRDDPNVVLVHYADLEADLDAAMRGLAARLGVPAGGPGWPGLVAAARFRAMRCRTDILVPDPGGVLRDRSAFFRRGRSGAAREVLTAEELAAYGRRVAALAPPDLLGWLNRP